MNRRITGALATLSLAAGLAFGGSTVGGVVTAERADAYTDSNCRLVLLNGQWYSKCWRDYSWWEENCLWCWKGTDGWVYTPRPYYPTR